MGYGSGWPEPQPEYSDHLHHHHYQHQYSAPRSLHHHHRSYFHHPPNPNPNPNSLPTCDPPAPAVPPPADPYAHPPVGPTPLSYYYGGAASGAGGGGGGGGGVEPHGFSVKDAIRQYGVDPVSYAGPPAPGFAPVTGYADPRMSGYADSLMVGFSDSTVGYAQAPPRPSHGLATHLQAPPLKPNWKGQSRKTTKVVQSAYCEVCKVDCTSQEVLNGHRQGKKHKKNLQKLQESITPKPMKAPSAVTPAVAKESQVASKGEAAITTGEKRKRKEAPGAATEEDLESKKKKMLEGGAAPDGVRVCTICNVVVNSQKVYDSHIVGQKHITMVKQQQQEKAAAS